MIDISAIAGERAKATSFSQKEWEDVIFYGSSLDFIGRLTDGEFVQLAKNSSSPEAYRNIVNLFESDFIESPNLTPAFDLLVEEVDASNFQLSDWLLGLNWVVKWCELHKHAINYRKSIGYIKCCAMSLESTPQGALPDTVKSMLETEGMA